MAHTLVILGQELMHSINRIFRLNSLVSFYLHISLLFILILAAELEFYTIIM